MPSKKQIEIFLNQDLLDYSLIKNLSEKALDRDIQSLKGIDCKDFQFKTTQREHQKASFICCYINNGFLVFNDVGLGKTKVILDTISLKLKLKPQTFGKTLVLTPNISVVGSWMYEIKTHSDLTSVVVVGTAEERHKKLSQDVHLYLMNYDGLEVLLTQKVILTDKQGKTLYTKKGRKKIKSLPDFVKITNFLRMFTCVVYDEIHEVANRGSLVFDLCSMLSHSCTFKYGLTATPIDRKLMMLWGMFFLIDGGETLGKNITTYRQAFFTQSKGFFGGFNYKIKEKSKVILHERLKNRSIRYSKEEAVNLPAKIYSKVPIILPKENRIYYNKAKSDCIEARGQFEVTKNIFVKYRQICGGFIGFKNEEEDKITIKFEENPKLDACIDLIRQTPEDSKILLFNEYRVSGDLICQRLKKEKIGHERLYGGTKQADKINVIKRFKNNKNVKVFVINNQSGGAGLNLQEATYVFYYETSVRPIIREQTEGRPHRMGQTNTVFIYDFIVKNSVEERILEFLKEGKDFFEAIILGEVKDW